MDRRRALVVSAASGGSGVSDEITFYIDDDGYITPMNALFNMTWEEFVNSEYANQNGMFTNFRLSDYGGYDDVKFYHEEAMQDMTLFHDIYHRQNAMHTDIIENGKTYYAY